MNPIGSPTVFYPLIEDNTAITHLIEDTFFVDFWLKRTQCISLKTIRLLTLVFYERQSTSSLCH